MIGGAAQWTVIIADENRVQHPCIAAAVVAIIGGDILTHWCTPQRVNDNTRRFVEQGLLGGANLRRIRAGGSADNWQSVVVSAVARLWCWPVLQLTFP